MDIKLEKKKGIQKKHIPYIVGGAVFVTILGSIIFGNHASTLKVDARGLNIGEVKKERRRNHPPVQFQFGFANFER